MDFFENYFYNFPEKIENFADHGPKTGKQRGQQPSGSLIPEDAAGCHGGGAAEAQISAANAESQTDPAIEGGANEEKIPKRPQLFRRGPQKSVESPQGCPDPQGPQQPSGGGFRPDHPFLRRNQPAGRGDSYTSAAICPSTATCPPSRERFFSCNC